MHDMLPNQQMPLQSQLYIQDRQLFKNQQLNNTKTITFENLWFMALWLMQQVLVVEGSQQKHTWGKNKRVLKKPMVLFSFLANLSFRNA